MHRFFIEPKSLSEDRSVWLGDRDDIRWRYLVKGFREQIRARQWKVIDLHVKLRVRVKVWEGCNVLVESLETKSDYYIASAYLKAGLLEDTPIIVYADDRIAWERLKEFRAVNSRRCNRHKGGAAGHNEETALGSARHGATEERRTAPSSLANGSGRTGKRDILAGGCRTPPQEGPAALDGGKVKPSSRSATLAGRPGGNPPGVTGA